MQTTSQLHHATYWQFRARVLSRDARAFTDLAMSSIRPYTRRTFELTAINLQHEANTAAIKARYFLALDS